MGKTIKEPQWPAIQELISYTCKELGCFNPTAQSTTAFCPTAAVQSM